MHDLISQMNTKYILFMGCALIAFLFIPSKMVAGEIQLDPPVCEDSAAASNACRSMFENYFSAQTKIVDEHGLHEASAPALLLLAQQSAISPTGLHASVYSQVASAIIQTNHDPAVSIAMNSVQNTPAALADKDSENHLNIIAGYDLWHVNWDVEGFAYSTETNSYQSSDYKIAPSTIKGVFFSAGTKTQSNNGWRFWLSLYGDYVDTSAAESTERKSELLKAIFSYNISSDSQLYTQVQRGSFQGEIVDTYYFNTEWTKVDLLSAKYNSVSGRTLAMGIRYLEYSMPVEYAIVNSETDQDIRHDIYYTKTAGIAFALSSADALFDGRDNGKWFFYDYDCAFGISTADADEFVDSVYGFQFNAAMDAGIKRAIHFDNKGLLALKLGYRIFLDTQILSEGSNSDEYNTTATLRNMFHGPFVEIRGVF